MTVYEEIQAELQYQDKKWGHANDDSKNTPWMWCAYIAQYCTRWMRGTFAPLDKATVDDFRKSMVKTAALAVAAIDSIDRQRAFNGTAFYETK